MACEPADVHLVDDRSCDAGRHGGTSPSQCMFAGSTTTLFIAVAELSPGRVAAVRL